MIYVGCHLSCSAGFAAMVESAKKLGANTFAYFTRNPRGSRAKELDLQDVETARSVMQNEGFGPLVAHGAYTMNLCTAAQEARDFAFQTLCDDLRRMAYLPGNYYNFHPGSHVGQGSETGISQICDSLKRAMEPDYPVTVLLETMAGKGTEVGRNFQELRDILDGVGREDLGVCLDTCHVYDGGYDLNADLEGVLEEFDRVVGLKRLKALHVNDSKNGCGSHKDRHAKIGEGSLGEHTFRRIVNHPYLKRLPMILETPNDAAGYRREISLLRGMEESERMTAYEP